MKSCGEHEVSVVVHHHRSCSGENNRLARSYHSGETGDMQSTLLHLRRLSIQTLISMLLATALVVMPWPNIWASIRKRHWWIVR